MNIIEIIAFLLLFWLFFYNRRKNSFCACMSGWPNDFVIGEEIGGNNKVRKSYDGRVVTLDGYIYYFGELMPTERNKCGELLFTPVFVNDSGEYVHVG